MDILFFILFLGFSLALIVSLVLLIISLVKKRPINFKRRSLISAGLLVAGFASFLAFGATAEVDEEAQAQYHAERELKAAEREAEKQAMLDAKAQETKEKEETEQKAEEDKLSKKKAEQDAKDELIRKEQEEAERAAKVEVDKRAAEEAEAKKKAEDEAAKKAAEEEKARQAELKRKEEENKVDYIASAAAYEVFKESDDEKEDVVKAIDFDEAEGVLSISVKGKDGWSESSMGRGFYEDSTALYSKLASDQRIKEAWITILFPMQDVYGNVEDSEVMGTWMSRETMDRINWERFDPLKLLDVVDGKRVYPQFVQ